MLTIFVYYSEREVLLLNPGVGDKLQVSNTDAMLQSTNKLEQIQGMYRLASLILVIPYTLVYKSHSCIRRTLRLK